MDEQLSNGVESTNIRFLKFTNDKEDAEKEAKFKEAAAKIEQAIARDKALNELIDYKEPSTEDQSLVNPANDTRSLYERLEEQRNKKKEAFEESHRLSNLITKLDEDDVNYLNEITKSKKEEELRKRLEIHDALEAKKRLAEQKMLDDERRLRESLLGTTSQQTVSAKHNSKDNQAIKSKLHSLIKVKSKPKSQMSEASKISSHQQKHQNPDGQSSRTKTNEESQRGRRTEARESGQKRPNVPASQDSSSLEPEKKRKELSDSSAGCICPKDVTKSLGILPSLPIEVKDSRPGSSEDDSDDSDEEINRRLVPRISSRRMHSRCPSR